jgi:hypothetical protein
MKPKNGANLPVLLMKFKQGPFTALHMLHQHSNSCCTHVRTSGVTDSTRLLIISLNSQHHWLYTQGHTQSHKWSSVKYNPEIKVANKASEPLFQSTMLEKFTKDLHGQYLHRKVGLQQDKMLLYHFQSVVTTLSFNMSKDCSWSLIAIMVDWKWHYYLWQ